MVAEQGARGCRRLLNSGTERSVIGIGAQYAGKVSEGGF